MGMIQENIQKNLARYLALNGMSQNQLAKRLHVSPPAVSLWISGKSSPDLASIARICEVLNISVAELLDVGKNEEYTAEEKLLITQYRAHPEFKQAVNRLLGLDEIYERQREQDSSQDEKRKMRAAAKRDEPER